MSGSALVAIGGDSIAANGELHAMRFVFLRAVIAANASVSGMLVAWHLMLVDEKTCVGALDVMYALKEVAKFICKSCLPNYSMIG